MSGLDSFLTTNPLSQKQRHRGFPFWHWSSAGIRAKILVPLVILMTLSLLGSTIGFTISTNTTRNRILDGQLNEESQRLAAALDQSERDVTNGALALARDPQLVDALVADMQGRDDDAVMRMDDRAVPVRDRFRLDQILLLSAEGQKRVNIATYSDLSPIPSYEHPKLSTCTRTAQTHIIEVRQTTLLVGCAPIWAAIPTGERGQREVIGTIYTVQDIARTLDRIRRELGLVAEIQLADKETLAELETDFSKAALEQASHSIGSYRVRMLPVPLGATTVDILLRHSEEEINEIVGSGFTVMLISSGMTLLLLLALGFKLAQSFTRPILKLVHVANAVADGDLSRRSHLHHNDEIGQLGQAFDTATETITDLLDQRARKAGELHAILQSMANGVLAIDTNEMIVMINPIASSLLGREQSELLGKPLASLVEIDEAALIDSLQRIVDQVRSELTDPDMAVTETRVSLGERVVLLNSAPTLGSAGVLTGAVVVLQDITEEVEADRAKSAFIATASHEMRTPLAAMKGFVDIFMMGGIDNLNENQRMFLSTIKRQTENMVQMVNDLLEMARLEQGKLRSEQRWVCVGKNIQEILANMQTQIENRQVNLQLDVNDNLPQIWIDSMHFRRILTNLVSNALKYVYQGGEVSIRAYELHDPSLLPSGPGNQPWRQTEQRSVVIEIEDNGVGIRESDQPKIFTRFFRSENPLTVEAGGSGLGLAITQSLVHLHHGQIGFRSVENEGSCFWIRLPAPSTEPLHDGEEHGQTRHEYSALV